MAKGLLLDRGGALESVFVSGSGFPTFADLFAETDLKWNAPAPGLGHQGGWAPAAGFFFFSSFLIVVCCIRFSFSQAHTGAVALPGQFSTPSSLVTCTDHPGPEPVEKYVIPGSPGPIEG